MYTIDISDLQFCLTPQLFYYKRFIFQLREAVQAKFEAPIEQLCLIFAGRILKDPDFVKSEGMCDSLFL